MGAPNGVDARAASPRGGRPPTQSNVAFALVVRRVGIAFQRYRAVAVRAGFGVGTSEGAVLGALHLEGALTPTELAARLNLSTPAMTEVLDRLERVGHVARGRHPSDRRKIVVSMTDNARTVIDRELPAFAALFDDVLGSLNASAVESLVRVLEQSASALDTAASRRAREAT